VCDTVGPALIVADDPLAAVDAAVGAELFRSLLSYARTDKCSVVLALNQLHLMAQCSHILHLEAGAVTLNCSFAEASRALPQFFGSEATDADSSEPRPAELDDVSPQLLTVEPDLTGAVTDAAKSGGQAAGQLEPESRLVGKVSNSILVRYINSFGLCLFVLCCVTALVAWGLMGFNDRWLAGWIEHSQDADPETELYIGVYIAGTAVFLIFLLVSSALVQIGAARAARSLHADCVSSLLRAPVQYFESTPSGRLLSRFSADVTTADNALAQFGDNWLQFSATIIVLYVVVIMLLPEMALAAVIVSIGTWVQVIAVDRSNREVKRLANSAMAPILTDVSEAADARLLLRHCAFEPVSGGATEFHAQRYFEQRFDADCNEFLLLQFCSCALVNWSQQVSYFVSLLFSVGVAVFIVTQSDRLSASKSALALSYSFTLPYFLMFFGFICSNVKGALARAGILWKNNT
jgi:ATP-binding cassette subfamily C (CFTR/MRP) protein 1